MDSAAEHIHFSNCAAAGFADHRFDVSGNFIAVGVGTATHHTNSAIVDDVRRGALGIVLPGISNYRRIDLCDRVRVGTPGRLDAADPRAAAALLLQATHVHRAVPLGEGSCQWKTRWVEGRGT